MLPRLDSIKQARIKLGITQKKLANMTGVSFFDFDNSNAWAAATMAIGIL